MGKETHDTKPMELINQSVGGENTQLITDIMVYITGKTPRRAEGRRVKIQ